VWSPIVNSLDFVTHHCLCLVRYLFVISTSVIDCLGRLVPEMTYYVSSGTLNLTKLKLHTIVFIPIILYM